jgi:hypothetical protein
MYGGVAAVVLIAAVSIGGTAESSQWQRTTASVYMIDRKCQIVETSYDGEYKRKSSRVYTDSCSSLDEWGEVRKKRTKDIAGKAVVFLNYTAPGSGQTQMGKLNFDGHDDEFYELKAGDQIEILVSEKDPTKVKKA